MLSLFSGEELKEVVGGKDKIDWGFIRKNVVEYAHPFKENHDDQPVGYGDTGNS